MGGDRDGNPNVTPAITNEVVMMSRWTAATLLRKDLVDLRFDLSLKSGSEELMTFTNGAYEPYRLVLKRLIQRLDATIKWTTDSLHRIEGRAVNNLNILLSNEEPIMKNEEVMEPLLLLHRSLLQTNNADVASGRLVDIIRRVAVFGVQLLPLDMCVAQVHLYYRAICSTNCFF